jgi:hypothetical protein
VKVTREEENQLRMFENGVPRGAFALRRTGEEEGGGNCIRGLNLCSPNTVSWMVDNIKKGLLNK